VQFLAVSGIAIVLLPGSRMSEIEPLRAALRSAVEAAAPGSVATISR
jgi:hypothetical protein